LSTADGPSRRSDYLQEAQNAPPERHNLALAEVLKDKLSVLAVTCGSVLAKYPIRTPEILGEIVVRTGADTETFRVLDADDGCIQECGNYI